MPIFKRSVHKQNSVSSTALQESAVRYRRARAGVSVGATALAMTVPLAMPNTAHAQFPASFDLSSLDGTNGFVINGVDAGDFSGFPVSGAGDINGDGVDDLIIAASFASPNGSVIAGESYVVFGQGSSGGGFNAILDLSTLNGTNGFVLNGVDAYDSSGSSVRLDHRGKLCLPERKRQCG